MHVKTYTGTSTQEVLAQIKAELGPDAVILSSRSFRKNGVRCHEVTAGLERGPTTAGNGQGGGAGKAGGVAGGAAALAGIMNSLNNQMGQMGQMGSSGQTQTYVGQGMGHPAGWSEWHKEWLQIKDHLFALMKPSIQLERLTPRQRVALEYLQREGVSDVVALELYRRLLTAPGESVLESLSELVPVCGWNFDAWPQRVHCLAGPFGAGKTTAGLRMALHLRQHKPELRMAFINADCHRGNGRLVLRHWAELSDFTYMEAQDATSMEKALVASAAADRVFIDLPGLGRDGSLAQSREALGLDRDLVDREDCATHLTLSPCYDHAQLAALLARYAVDGPGSLIWCKLDEAISYGTLVNTGAACRLPVSALSFGPGLKESLTTATESLLWRLIFKRQLPDAAALSESASARRT